MVVILTSLEILRAMVAYYWSICIEVKHAKLNILFVCYCQWHTKPAWSQGQIFET